MHPLPHAYRVQVSGSGQGDIAVDAEGLPRLATESPPEFDGPGGRWSPESLLCAAVASCFILTFRAVARASKFDWQSLECDVEGTLDRKDGAFQFTRFTTRARLKVGADADRATAERLLQKSERACLITNSLKAEQVLATEIVQG